MATSDLMVQPYCLPEGGGVVGHSYTLAPTDGGGCAWMAYHGCMYLRLSLIL